MKYTEAKMMSNGMYKIVKIKGMKEKEAKGLEGKLFCPGDGCEAPLYIAHNSKDGGKSIFFKATNENHTPDCIYRNENQPKYKSGSTDLNGVYTESQINDYVRHLYKDINSINKGKKEVKDGPQRKKQGATSGDDNNGKPAIKGGKIIAGLELSDEGKKGRMSRRYSVSEADIGYEVGVYGEIKEIKLDEFGQIHMKFKEDRYSELEVLIGQVYKNINEGYFNYLKEVKCYVDTILSNGHKVELVAAGLVTKYKDKLVLELQAKYSFKINGLNILDIIRIKAT